MCVLVVVFVFLGHKHGCLLFRIGHVVCGVHDWWRFRWVLCICGHSVGDQAWFFCSPCPAVCTIHVLPFVSEECIVWVCLSMVSPVRPLSWLLMCHQVAARVKPCVTPALAAKEFKFPCKFDTWEINIFGDQFFYKVRKINSLKPFSQKGSAKNFRSQNCTFLIELKPFNSPIRLCVVFQNGIVRSLIVTNLLGLGQ